MPIYGILGRPTKRQLSNPPTALATAVLTAMMVALSVAWLRWKARRPGPQQVKAAA
jgi:hypothetical protein